MTKLTEKCTEPDIWENKDTSDWGVIEGELIFGNENE